MIVYKIQSNTVCSYLFVRIKQILSIPKFLLLIISTQCVHTLKKNHLI